MNLKLVPGTLRSCYASIQEMFNDAFSKGYALLVDTLKGVLVQDAFPTVDQQTNQLWWRTVGGAPVGGGLVFYNGAWVGEHPIAPGLIMEWDGDITQIDTFDGGETAAITATTGPFWTKYSAADGRFSIAPGTLPSGATVSVGGTGGEEKHTLLQAELPNLTLNATGVGRASANLNVADPGGFLLGIGSVPGTEYTGPIATLGGTGNAFNTMPPYIGLWKIQRTARVYRRYP